MKPETRLIFDKACRTFAEVGFMDLQSTPGAAVHTAYYAMFHAARAVLHESHGTVSTKHGAVHSAFETLLKGEPESVRHHAGDLRGVYDARLIQDYTARRMSTDDATEIVAAAAEFLAFCAARLGLPIDQAPPTDNP